MPRLVTPCLEMPCPASRHHTTSSTLLLLLQLSSLLPTPELLPPPSLLQPVLPVGHFPFSFLFFFLIEYQPPRPSFLDQSAGRPV